MKHFVKHLKHIRTFIWRKNITFAFENIKNKEKQWLIKI